MSCHLCKPYCKLRAIDTWDQRNEEGLGLIQLAEKSTIQQSIKENETHMENWKHLTLMAPALALISG